MRQKLTLLTKTMLLLCALMAGSGSAWADTTVSTTMSDYATNHNWTTSTSGNEVCYTSFSLDANITISTTGEANCGSFWGSDWRLYHAKSGNVIVTAASNYKLKSVTFTFGVANNGQLRGPGESTNALTSGTAVSISGSSATFSVYTNKSGKTNGQVKITAISVTYEAESSDPSSSFTFTTKEPEISFPATTTYTGAFSVADNYAGSISYELTDNTCGASINQENGEVTVTGEGSVTVTATAAAVAGSFSQSTDSYTLTVTDTRTEANISWSSDAEVKIAQGAADGDYTLPTLYNPSELPVAYTITGTDDLAVEVDGEILVDTDVLGSVTVTASYTGDAYKPKSVSYKITVYDPTVRDGSITNPYNVADVIEGVDNTSNVYVKGFIVGSYNATAPQTGSSMVNTNLALADTPDETDGKKTIPVELKSSFRPSWGLTDGGKAYNVGVAQVLIQGNAKAYFSVNGIKELSSITKLAEQVSITAAGMATYYTDCALDFTGFSDMYAYTTSLSGDAITFTRVTTVPANTGVLLRNPNGQAAASQLVPVAESASSVTSAFVGTLTDIASLVTTPSEGTTNYILNNGTQGVGFYKANGQSLTAHKAYLQTTGSGVRSFIGFEEEATGIADVEMAKNAGGSKFYNLSGQRVAQPTKGLYIVNGKKVTVK